MFRRCQETARELAVLIALVAAGLALPSCHGGGCPRGQLCECAGGTDCFLGCGDGDGCQQLCHQMVRCGEVCGNGCLQTCSDMNDCTTDCGDDCRLDCHNTVSCGAICGARCDFACTSADRCGARVGPDSTVDCTGITTCEVECAGRCRVTCSDVNNCGVSCLDGSAPISCSGSGNVVACGSC
jgi:hypothetical protein